MFTTRHPCTVLAVSLSLFLCLCYAAETAQAAQDYGILYEGEFNTAGMAWERSATGEYTPSLPGTQLLAESDKPVLASQSLLLLVPRDAAIGGIEVVPLATHHEPLPGLLSTAAPLISSEGVTVTVDRLASGPEGFPLLWGEYAGSHYFRGFRLLAVQLYPLRAVRDASGDWTALEVLDRYAIRLLPPSREMSLPEVIERQRRVPGERQRVERMLRRMVANPEVLAGYARADGELVPEPAGGFSPTMTPTMSGSAVSYLIITNSELAPVFEVLADYKTAQGLPAVVATVEWITANFRNGADLQETIRLFIRDAYEKWGVEWVLLGGDADVIPPRFVRSTYYPPQKYTDIPVDLYFACLDGNWNADGDYLFGEAYISEFNPGDEADLQDEVFIGRAPVSTLADAVLFVNKTIGYNETPAGEAWTNRALFAAEVLFPQEWQPGDQAILDGANFATGIIDSFLVPCTTMENTRMFQNYTEFPGSIPETRQAFIDSVNTGHYALVNQIGHGFFFNMSLGDLNFTVSDADALTNGDHWFMIYALNCASAAFDHSCLLERFIQNPNGGSMVSIGSSRAAFPYTANEYQEEFFDQLFCQEATRVGELVSLSRVPYFGNTMYNTVHRWTYMVYALMGDPALSIWSSSPQEVQVTAPGALNTGQQVVNITVNSGGSPVEGALVCLFMDGVDYAVGYTNPAGNVSLSMTPTRAGNVSLTITGTNLEFTQSNIPVTTGSTYIAVEGVQIVDDGSDSSIGNGNNAPESGETVALYLECRDTSGGGATNCSATLTSSALGINIIDGTAYVGNIPASGIHTAQEPFLISIDPDVSDGFLANFDIVITDGSSGTYQNEWTMAALAPEAEPVELIWSDSTYGNGNGIIEDGERLTVKIILKNYGVGLADHITATLRTADLEFTIQDSIATYTNIGLLESAVGSTSFSLSDADASTAGWCWVLFTDNWGRTFRHDFQLQYVSVPTNILADTFEGPDVIALYWTPVQDPSLRGYNVYRSESFGGPYGKVNADLIDGISYFRDSGLGTLTRYYYQIAAVDSSLSEGRHSSIVSLSTAPPEVSPYPLPVGTETSGPLAVGDVTGDGRLEIVLASDEIYVWRDDGTELFDGDFNSQTLGPITNLDSDFQPAGVALAPLDSEPGLDIVVCGGRYFNGVHVFNANDGNELTGWPQDVKPGDGHWAWATPAVGDVDGDGDLEIVVNTLDGCTWVWHHDGTELVDGDDDPSTNGLFNCRPEGDGLWSVSSPALADLDGDGAKDIIFGTKFSPTHSEADNYILAYRYDRSYILEYYVGQGNVLASPAVADLNNDGVLEIIVHSQNDTLHVVQENGVPFPGFPVPFISEPGASPLSPSPAVGNFDMDDDLEIVSVSTVGPDTAYVYVFDTGGGTSGQPLPGWPRYVAGSTESSPVVGDIDGDGVPDILHGIGGGSEESPNKLYGFKADGEYVDGFPITLLGPARASPYICDLDQDNDVDIVYSSWGLMVHVWDMPFDYDSANVPWATFQANYMRTGKHGPLGPVDVPEQVAGTELMLMPPYPNPFNPATTVKLYLPGVVGAKQELKVGVYDLRGRRVRTLHEGLAITGWHTWVWDGKDNTGRSQASGMYFLRARSGEYKAVKKMALIK